MTGYAAPGRPSWREERRQERLLAARIGIEREAERSRAAIAAADAAETRRAARATARRREREATMSAASGWAAGHVLDLLFVPVIGVPALLAWTAMAVYGLSLYGGVGVLLPLFSEFSMWAFAAAVTITRRKDARRREDDPDAGPSPVWHLRSGITVFAVFAAALNAAHGMSPGTPHHGPVTAAVMALVSVAGVIAHQLITAGPRRTRADRDDAMIGRAVRRRVLKARLTAVKEADTQLDTTGMVRLKYRADIPADTGTDTAESTTPAAPDSTTDTPPLTRPDSTPDTVPAAAPDTAPAPKRTPGRTRRRASTADRVAAMRDRHPGESAADIAARLKISDRTVRRYLPKPADQPQETAA